MEYTIGQISEKTGLKPHVLRYYEKEGLLPSVSRSVSGIRRYSGDDLEWLGLVCCLKNTGMSIKQIRNFISLSVQGDETLQQRCELLTEHKRQVEQRIAEMREHLQKVDCKIEHFTARYIQYQRDHVYDSTPVPQSCRGRR